MENTKMMNLEEAIEHCKKTEAKEKLEGNLECALEHKQLSEWLSDYKNVRAKADAYDELKCMPNLPGEYNVFLVYLVRNRGDFHKTIRVLTDEGRCSLECMEWFAMMLGISWEPDWR